VHVAARGEKRNVGFRLGNLEDGDCPEDLSTGLFKMIVGGLTTCHTQYTSDSSICIFI
jgi:hypothetical protein